MDHSAPLLRRSPRKHSSSTPSYRPGSQQLFSQNRQHSRGNMPESERQRHLASMVQSDELAFQDAPVTLDKYPAPPPPLSAVVDLAHDSSEEHPESVFSSGESNVRGKQLRDELEDHALLTISPHAENAYHPSTQAGTTQPPSTYAGTTQPPSTYAGTTQSPSTYAGTTQQPSTYAGTTQPPSTYAGTTQPPSTYAGTTQPPSTYAGTTQPPSTYAGTTQPPSTYAGTTQPPSTYAGTTQPPSTYAGTTQPPSPYNIDLDQSPSIHARQIQSPSVQAEITPGASGFKNAAQDASLERNGQSSGRMNATQTMPAPRRTVSRRVSNINSTDASAEDDEVEQNAGASQRGQEDENDPNERNLKQLFAYLNRSTVKLQKAIATAFNITHAGNKKARAARIYVILSSMVERDGKTPEEVLEAKGIETNNDFVSGFRRIRDHWCDDGEEQEFPPMSELEKLGGVVRPPTRAPQTNADPTVGNGSNGEEGNTGASRENFSLEEFARLMLIFRDVPEAGADLRRSGQDLTRQQLDLHTNRNAFWDSRIEPLFNDQQAVFNEVFEGELRDIDPGRPITTFRTGTCLQNMFQNFRKEFTIIYKRWDVSGNLDPGTFVKFCYMPKTTFLSKAGKRCLIAFKVFRLGTPHRNTLILDFGSREIAENANAQLEGGLVQNDTNAVGSKRKRTSLDDVNSAVLQLVNSITSEDQSVRETAQTKKRREELDELAVQGATLENDRKRIDSMATAMKYAREIEPNAQTDTRILDILRSYCGKLADEMQDRLQA